MSSRYISYKLYIGILDKIVGVCNMIRLTLDKLLDEQGISRYELAKRTGTRFHIIDNYYKNKVVRYDSDLLDRICEALHCDISDLLEYRK